ncbi:MAG: molybdopterin-guanine dinucleotide biosynthesis protein B [Candidatus Bathyarchaeia archaeon]
MINIPSFAIIGTKKSGKTTITEALISNFVKDGLKVVAIKNVHEGSLAFTPNLKDSWRLFQAGAVMAIAISPNELELLKRIGANEKKLEILFKLIQEEFDVVFLEGFKELVLEREDIAKILVIKNLEEAYEFLKNSKNIIAITGELDKSSIENLASFQIPIFNYKKDINVLIYLVKKHYNRLSLVFKTMNELPLLNCGHCGYKNCFEFAKAIVDKVRAKDDCFILKQEEKVQVKILGKKLPLHPFVQDFIRKTVLGMLSSLKHVEIKGDENITITLTNSKFKN